jgi:hypothetical protein
LAPAAPDRVHPDRALEGAVRLYEALADWADWAPKNAPSPLGTAPMFDR